jgi:hypothetical protein
VRLETLAQSAWHFLRTTKICSWNNWLLQASFWMTWQFSSIPYYVNCRATLIALALWAVLPHVQSEIDDMRGLWVEI